MTKVSFDASMLRDENFCRLCTALGYSQATTLGLLNILWAVTREAHFEIGAADHLRQMLPVDDASRDAFMAALKKHGFVCEDEVGQVFVVHNRDYFRVIATKRLAGKKGRAALDIVATAKGKRKAAIAGRAQKQKDVALQPMQQRTLQLEGRTQVRETEAQKLCRATWESYRASYVRRWRFEPTRNAQVNSNIKTFVTRVGAEAPQIIAAFVGHNKREYVQAAHSMKLAVRDAEGLRLQWQRGEEITAHDLDEAERQNAIFAQMDRVGRGEA